jgi:hypothetical protein
LAGFEARQHFEGDHVAGFEARQHFEGTPIADIEARQHFEGTSLPVLVASMRRPDPEGDAVPLPGHSGQARERGIVDRLFRRFRKGDHTALDELVELVTLLNRSRVWNLRCPQSGFRAEDVIWGGQVRRRRATAGILGK